VEPVRPKSAVPFLTNRSVHCPASLMKGIGKRNEKWLESDSSWLGPVRSENVVPSLPGIIWHGEAPPHVINTILRHYVRFWIFWQESFEARKKRLATRGSVSQARKIASPFLVMRCALEVSIPSRYNWGEK